MPDPVSVLRAIDTALEARDRHPRLFGEHLAKDRSCDKLAAAYERHKARRPEPTGGRLEIDEVERVDPDWEEANARQREEEFSMVRRERAATFTYQWDMMSRSERIIWIETELRRMSTLKAASMGSSRGGDTVGQLPAGIDADGNATADAIHAVDVTGDLYVIDTRLDRIRDEIRAAQGLGALQSTVTMTSDEKDGEIAKATGVPASKLSQAKPWLGSPETIRRVRRKMGLDTLGNPLPRVFDA